MSYLGSLWAGHSAPVWRIGHLLILRLTPLGLHLPRSETTVHYKRVHEIDKKQCLGYANKKKQGYTDDRAVVVAKRMAETLF